MTSCWTKCWPVRKMPDASVALGLKRTAPIRASHQHQALHCFCISSSRKALDDQGSLFCFPVRQPPGCGLQRVQRAPNTKTSTYLRYEASRHAQRVGDGVISCYIMCRDARERSFHERVSSDSALLHNLHNLAAPRAQLAIAPIIACIANCVVGPTQRWRVCKIPFRHQRISSQNFVTH